MSTQNVTRKKLMIQALEKSLGVVTTACKDAGIARKTHYKWYNDDPEYREAVDSIGDIAIDFVESQLFKQINSGVPSSTMFYLKTKAKHRGYIETINNDITSGGEKINAIFKTDPLDVSD